MTGGSLGLRSASYGTLQQQQLNGATLPTLSPPFSVRKTSKMSLSGAREKERFLPWICKIAGRRKVGMLLLLLACVAVLSFVSVVSKDEDPSATPDIHPGFTDNSRILVNQERSSVFRPTFITPKDNFVNASIDSNQRSVNADNVSRPPIAVLPPSTTFAPHPCENFTFAPPPVDRKRTGPRPCPVCYVPVEQAVAFMPSSASASPVLKNLNYLLEDNSLVNESDIGSRFGGHPSLQQRKESFDIKETMSVYCGFVGGKKPGLGSGFDIDEADLLEMEKCHGVVVASAIFGNYDIMQQPSNISEYTKKNACFYMFVDEETEAYIKNTSSLDDTKRVGLWRVVVVRNLPYADARRTGKVPKLLLHRLFPNARYSLWIDGKLELVVDPYQILERFLWRTNSTFAISRHYRRFDVFEEAEANKAAGKYDNASIDHQIEFYKEEGLTHYTPAKLPITSDVPEGCVIIREHIPVTNLFTCLWFNEVDRFTSRDQISFSTVRDKIMATVNWTINMFMDCERRNFVVQAYHRDLLQQRNAHVKDQPPSAVVAAASEKLGKAPPLRKPPGKISMKRGKDKKPGSRRRHPKNAAGREASSI